MKLDTEIDMEHVETPLVPKTTYELLMEQKYERLFTACMEAHMWLGAGDSKRALQVLSQALLFVLLLCCLAVPVQAKGVHAPNYRAVCLGYVGQPSLNNSGAVTGTLLNNSTEALPTAVLFSNGHLQPFHQNFWPASINNSMSIVGSAPVIGASGGFEGQHAVSLDGGTFNDLGTLDGGDWAQAVHVNSSGLVLGNSLVTGGDYSHAFLWQDGNLVDIGAFWASDLNDAGTAVGYTIGQVALPVVYANGVMQAIPLGFQAVAVGINNSGQILLSDGHALVMDTGGNVTDLGSLGGQHVGPARINERGEVVGWSGVVSQNAPYRHAFVYTSGLMWDLNLVSDAGTVLVDAYDINQAGQIVAVDANNRCFLLTPVSPKVAKTLITP